MLGGAWAWIWSKIPDKRYVDNKVSDVESRFTRLVEITRSEDSIADRALFADLIRPVHMRLDTVELQQKEAREARERQHQEGMRLMRRILAKLGDNNA